jgi:hypothetical protein
LKNLSYSNILKFNSDQLVKMRAVEGETSLSSAIDLTENDDPTEIDVSVNQGGNTLDIISKSRKLKYSFPNHLLGRASDIVSGRVYIT